VTVEVVTERATRVVAANPGPMTLEGTNTWILRAPGATSAVVVDPGPLLPDHLQAVLDQVASYGCRVEVVLLTHGHYDHSEGAAWFAERAACGIRSVDPSFRVAASTPEGDPAYGPSPDAPEGPAHGLSPDAPVGPAHGVSPDTPAGPAYGLSPDAPEGLAAYGLADGSVITAEGLRVEVLSTPGHTADSVCFYLAEEGSLLTGDTVLGRGTSVVAHPDGALGPYLKSLERLQTVPGVQRLLPGHGPVIDQPAEVLAYYLRHRAERLDQVRAAVSAGATTPEAVVRTVYADVDPILWPAAERSVRAQLDYLTNPD
jgi:glyoxylase-like metal-dependent hydrolase (beta-lactamase superfamily II)